MSYGLAQTTAPTEDPLSVDEVKLRLGIATAITVTDEMMRSQLKAAIKWVEDRTNRQLCAASWTLTLDRFPWGGAPKIYLPRAPLRSVTSIYYLGVDGVSTLWSSANYRVATNKEPGEITLAFGVAFPSIYLVSNSVTILYSAGYGAAIAVPDTFKQAITLKCGEWWAANERDAAQCERSCQNLITTLGYGDEFTQYGEEMLACR